MTASKEYSRIEQLIGCCAARRLLSMMALPAANGRLFTRPDIDRASFCAGYVTTHGYPTELFDIWHSPG